MPRKTLYLLSGLAVLLLAVFGLAWYVSTPSNSGGAPPGGGWGKEPRKAGPSEASGRQRNSAEKPSAPGMLRLSDDAAAKHGDFWIEQHLAIHGPLSEGPLLDLYLSINPKNASGLRLRLTKSELLLERAAPASPQAPGPSGGNVLAKAKLSARLARTGRTARTERGHGKAVLGALWRKGELSAWWNGECVLAWKGSADLTGPSAAMTHSRALRLGARRVLDLRAISFHDSFMRASAGGAWRPAAGKWELTALAFPERSANPFSLRCSFGDVDPAADRLYRDRLRRDRFGIGVALGYMEGTLHILRITGGSPAARAGLQEDDTILFINGLNVEKRSPWAAQRLLTTSARQGRPLHLKILRPGEKRLRTFTLTGDMYRWGTPLEAKLIQPVSDDAEALILGGEGGWTDYAAEVSVKALGSGGFGLAIAATSKSDYVLLRWIGPRPRRAIGLLPEAKKERAGRAGPAAAEEHEKLQLLRVQKGKETVLAEQPWRYRPYEFYRLGLDWRGEEVRARVDGQEVFAKKIPGLRRGQVGLYAMRGDPVFFDDVAVASNREQLARADRPGRTVNTIFEQEQDMERWANPALEWRRDGQSAWAIHRARFPGTQALALTRPRFDELEVKLLCGADPQGPAGAVFRVRNGQASFQVRTGLKTVQKSAPVKVGPGPFERIVIRAGAKGVEAQIGTRRVPAPGLKPAFPGSMRGGHDRIAVRGLKNLGDPATARPAGSRVLEYDFDRAPSDWKVESGRWGLLNKWICDPRWSWFGGRSETVGAIWNKRRFLGDVSVEAYVALMMRRDAPPYERAGDFNLLLCGDGVHPDSGYSVVVGGGGNYWTRLYRRGRQVAEARAEKFRFPSDRVRRLDKPQLHQRWFRLRLEKIGDRIAFYRDGAKAFEFRDPKPIPSGRVAFWTVQNGVLLARCRIAFEKEKHSALESRRAELFDDGRVINMFDGEVHTRVEREALPKAMAKALYAAGRNFHSAQAAPVRGAPAPGQAAAWRVTNETGGGAMALQWKTKLMDPGRMGVLRFALRIEPGAVVDLYLKNLYTNRYYRWALNGPDVSSGASPLVARIPGVKADGRWHAIQFDLEPSWSAFWKRRGLARPNAARMRPLIACLENAAYAVAGFHANRVGAVFAVSDLTFLKPADVDFTPPRLARVVWPFDAAGDGRSLQLFFDDAGGSGVAPASLHLTLNARKVPGGELRFDARTQAARLDLLAWRHGRKMAEGERIALALEPFADRAGNRSAHGAKAEWTFTLGAARRAKKPVAAPTVNVLMDGLEPASRRRRFAPSAPALALKDVRPLAGYRELSVRESADAPPWAARKRSVRVAALKDGAHFGFRLRKSGYDLARWPYLYLEYKVPEEVPVNFHFRDANGMPNVLVLSDLGDSSGAAGRGWFGRGQARFGPPRGFVDDGTWRRISVPLLKLFSAARPGLASWNISNLEFRDGGWRGNRTGMAYAIHAVRALPAARSRGLAFTWSTPDLAGIRAYASAVDTHPGTVPRNQDIRAMESVEGAARRARRAPLEGGQAPPARHFIVSDGWKYLHVRVQNAAGVWSPTTHYRFRVDNTPPRVARTEPAEGGWISGKRFRVHFAEEHAIRPHSIQVDMNGQTFHDGQPGVRFDPAANVLTFDGAQLGKRLDWPSGARITVALSGATDALGNVMSTPYRFAFTRDITRDRQGPRIAQVRYCAPSGIPGRAPRRPILMELSMALDFEETLGHVRALRDCRLDWTDDRQSAAFGRRAVKIVALEDDADVRVMLHKNAWYMDRFPLLHFDYKTKGGVKVDLQVEVLGEWYTIRFLGGGKGQKTIGRVRGVKADGTWHHAGVDLRAAIQAHVPNLPVGIISQVKFSAHGQRGTRRGASLWLDNLHLCPEAGAGGRLEWRAQDDPSGIEGYSVWTDRQPETEAPRRITDLGTFRPEGNRSGTWYAHLRARDQAGNWGPTRHFRMDF